MTVVAETVYLDVCCFKRPFDDAGQPRVRREAEAVAAVLEAATEGLVRLVRSPAHDAENDRNPREDRRLATRIWLEAAAVRVGLDEKAVTRTRELVDLGFGPLDALHLACAEQAGAQWFATTDDRLLARARRHHQALRISVVGPAAVPLGTRDKEGE